MSGAHPLDTGSVSAVNGLSGAQESERDNKSDSESKSKPTIKRPSPRAELTLEALLDRALEEVSMAENSPEASGEASQPSQTKPLETDEQARAAASAAACSLIEETAKLSGVQLKDLLAGLGDGPDVPAFKAAQLDAIASAVRPVGPRPRVTSDDLLQPPEAPKKPNPVKIAKVKPAEPPKVIQNPVEKTVEECSESASGDQPAETNIEEPVVQTSVDATSNVESEIETPTVETENTPEEISPVTATPTLETSVERVVEQVEEKDTFPLQQNDGPKTWTNNDFQHQSAVSQVAEAGTLVMKDDRVSRTDLVHLLEGFVKILRTDAKSNLPAEVNYDLTANGGRYTDAIVDDRTQEIENMRKVIVDAQETIIKLLTDRVEDRAKIASLETQIKLLPDLQAQADRAMAVAIHTEDFRSDLTKVKFELERYRLARVRAEAENRKSWFRKVWVWINRKCTRTLSDS